MTKKQNKIKLFSYLNEMNLDEMYRLKRYIHADYFNTNERLKRLFDAIQAVRAEKINYEEIEPMEVYKTVFPDHKVSAMDVDFSDILKLVHGFIAQEEYNNDKPTAKRYLLSGLESRKATDRFERIVNREAKNYELGSVTKRIDNQNNYLHDLLIALQKFQHYTIYKNRKIVTNKALQELVYSIDRFYTIFKTNFSNSMRQRTSFMQHEFDYGSTMDFEKVIRQAEVEKFPLLHIRYYLYLLWKNESVKEFDRCRNILIEYSQRLSADDHKNLFQVLINFCRISVMGTQPKMWNERQAELYQQFFERGFCYTGSKRRKQQISPHHFKNYMQLLIELNRFEEFKQLEEKYRVQVHHDNKAQRRFVNQYNSTALYFAQYVYYGKNKRSIGEEFAYDTTFEYIQNMEKELAIGKQEYPGIFYRISYEILLLKIFFEQKEGFANRRSIFYKYIKNQKYISPVYFHPYLNFANVVLKLYRLKSKPKNTTDLHQLRNDIVEMRIVERIWLNDKLEDLFNI